MAFPFRAAALAGVFLAGCTVQAKLDDNQLMSSGFTKVSVASPEWAETAQSLPVHRFTRRDINGVPMVLYYDPVACGCVYQATPAVYADYRARRQAEWDQLEDASLRRGGRG